jgi:ubiquinone biosynthesis protein UbiJ
MARDDLLTQSEVQAIARNRLLSDMVNEIVAVCAAENPEMAQAIEEVLVDYRQEVAESCMTEQNRSNVDALIECIEDKKERTEASDRLRERLEEMRGGGLLAMDRKDSRR